jgi:DNA-binding Lrp family transcriptional regulator
MMDELLKILKSNALESDENIAKMLCLSEEDIIAKKKEYEDSGVILGYQAILNEDKLDTELVRAIIGVKITPIRDGGFNNIATQISKFDEVENCYLVSGNFDLMAVLRARNLKGVARFVSEKLSMLDGVISVETHFMLKVYKDKGILAEEEVVSERLQVSP